MIFGKHINRYYLKYGIFLLIGVLTLAAVDYLQLIIPGLYQMTVNGINQGFVMVDGERVAFDMPFLLDKICMPMVAVILSLVFGRFLWRICFFEAAIRVETDLRNAMFDNARFLSREYYQVNKVGTLMSLFTNAAAGRDGGEQNVENELGAGSAFHDPHGAAAGNQLGGGPPHDAEMGRPPGRFF